jgi:hypothetical protein
MRPLDCPRCYAAAERSGVLVRELAKAGAALHLALRHEKFNWMYCLEAPCFALGVAIRGTGDATPK